MELCIIENLVYDKCENDCDAYVKSTVEALLSKHEPMFSNIVKRTNYDKIPYIAKHMVNSARYEIGIGHLCTFLALVKIYSKKHSKPEVIRLGFIALKEHFRPDENIWVSLCTFIYNFYRFSF